MLMQLDERDNVAVCLTDAKAGQALAFGEATVSCLTDIPFGHKCALTDIASGELIVKYGCPIGVATADVKRGEIVREHNMRGLRGRGDLEKA